MPIMYSSHCPKCKTLEIKLKQKNIEYEVCDDVAHMQEIGITSLPMLEVDGERYDFAKAIKWVNSQV